MIFPPSRISLPCGLGFGRAFGLAAARADGREVFSSFGVHSVLLCALKLNKPARVCKWPAFLYPQNHFGKCGTKSARLEGFRVALA